MSKFPRNHAATKKMIASCAANGAGIEGLEDAPNFRFIPAQWGGDSFKGRENCGPSKRGSVRCGPPKPKNIRNWNPPSTSLDPQYSIAMAGDDEALTKARKAYAAGDPDLLRKYLSSRAAPQEYDL